MMFVKLVWLLSVCAIVLELKSQLTSPNACELVRTESNLPATETAPVYLYLSWTPFIKATADRAHRGSADDLEAQMLDAWDDSRPLSALDPSDPRADGSRYALMRTTAGNREEMIFYYTGWVIVSVVPALASLFVILLILCKPRIRASMHNKFIVGLAFPDFFFSANCVYVCWQHAVHGEFYGGVTMCEWQSFFCIFGFVASIWMNVVITGELYRLAVCTAARRQYRPLNSWSIAKRISAVYLLAATLSASIWFGGPWARAGVQRGLACLPMPANVGQEVYFWLVTVTLMLGVPLLTIGYFLYKVHSLLLRGEDGKKGHVADREIFVFFVRLLTVLVGMWLPTALLIWLFVFDATVAIQWLGGVVSHMQGFVSAMLVLRKRDIRSELAELCGCLSTRVEPSRSSNSRTTGGRMSSGRWPLSEKLRRKFRAAHKNQSEGVLAVTSTDVGARRRSSLLNTGLSHLGFLRDSQYTQEANAAIERMSKAAKADIIQQEQTPMLVISYNEWIRVGHFPHSSEGLTNEVGSDDVVVFVSHRWWRPEDQHPDTRDGKKYALVTRGLRAIIRKHALNPAKVAIWCDFASIDQDNKERQHAGIASLISYVARSSFVLVPVQDEPLSISAFARAMHPIALVNYGERAWCRLETYAFLCLSEITRVPLNCYGYGLAPLLPGMEAYIPACMHREVLRRLVPDGVNKQSSSIHGAHFDLGELPSSGEVTVASDTSKIKVIEEDMRVSYVQSAILVERARFVATLKNESAFELQGKQLTDAEIPFLSDVLRSVALSTDAPTLIALRLDGNLLSDAGFPKILDEAVREHTETLHELSISNNIGIGHEAMKALARWLPTATNLKALYIAECGLLGNELGELVGALSECPHLRVLDLHGNKLDDTTIEALLPICYAGTRKINLNIEENPDVSRTIFREASILAGIFS